jgi:hypothetical protein
MGKIRNVLLNSTSVDAGAIIEDEVVGVAMK